MVTVTEKMQMFENKVNTSKKRTKLACLNDRKNYLQNDFQI